MRFSPLMPFFATLFMAAAFFYFQYTYTKLKVIDFSEFVFYGSDFVFSPKESEYIVLLYNSKVSGFAQIAKAVPNESGLTILAIDFYQNKNQTPSENVVPLSAGINTLLKLSRIFRVDKIPAYFRIKQKKATKYAQDSKIYSDFVGESKSESKDKK